MSKLALCFALLAAFAHATPVHLRTDALNTPIGLDTPQPTFSWISDATTPNWIQSAYEILVDTDERNLRVGKASSWDSGRVASSESVDIWYAGTPLKPQHRYAWKVITWAREGKMTASAPTWFETGLLSTSDWKAQWITRKNPEAEKELSSIRWVWLQGADAMHVASATPAHFHYEFQLDGTPLAGSLHVLVRGSFIARVNGQVTGHHDEWGAFDREEIGFLLHSGKNEIDFDVASHRTYDPAAQSPAALAAAIDITRADGTEERLVTDEKWQARSTPEDSWQPVQLVGPLSAAFGIGTDRQQPIPGPDRIVTDASLLRKDFTLESPIQTARLTITALGAYHAFINHQPVAPNTLLAPGWTDFHKRVQYQTYDVTPLLNSGANTIGVVLGGGWYSSPMTWAGFRSYLGPNLLRAQLDLTFANGQHETIITDPSWQTAPAPITFSEIYGGES
jgi:alpha-L-rhamnosidase